MVLVKLFAGQIIVHGSEGTDAENRLTDSGAEEGRREGTYGESDMEMYMTICKIASGICSMSRGTQIRAL